MEIAGVVKNSFVDYPGHIACVVFVPGCNMNCWYCHNREIITMKKGTVSQDKFFSFLDNRKNFLEAVVISGGEPTLQEDIIEFAKKVKNIGYKIKLDTNGTNPQVVKEMVDLRLVDYIAMDIKAPLNNYNKITYIEDIKKVEESIRYIKGCGVDYEFRTTFAPNLTKEDVLEIVNSIKGAKRYSLQAYVRPMYIKEGKLKEHSAKTFFEIKAECDGMIDEFLVKNIDYTYAVA